jgi:glycosyltransferase involved in cell wall biosynthesis
MYKGQKVSVVMPAYNEEAFIATAIRDLRQISVIDEIIVVNNNSTDKTEELAIREGARVVREPKQGYGYASKRALLEGTGQLIFIVEPDGTFRAGDLLKYLPYSEEFDAVFGTRTSKSCIWQGANMGIFLRYGNAIVAKLLEYLHNGPCLTDVGCTLKMIKREVVHRIAPYLVSGASHFSPELMIVLIRTGMRCVEIPVHYRVRLGESKITGNFNKALRLGLRMITLIILYRFRRFPKLGTTIPPAILREIGEHVR